MSLLSSYGALHTKLKSPLCPLLVQQLSHGQEHVAGTCYSTFTAGTCSRRILELQLRQPCTSHDGNCSTHCARALVQESSDVTVIMCSEGGNVTVWPNFMDEAEDGPRLLAERAGTGVTALSVSRAPGDGFLAVLGFGNGAISTVTWAGEGRDLRLDIKPFGSTPQVGPTL